MMLSQLFELLLVCTKGKGKVFSCAKMTVLNSKRPLGS